MDISSPCSTTVPNPSKSSRVLPPPASAFHRNPQNDHEESWGPNCWTIVRSVTEKSGFAGRSAQLQVQLCTGATRVGRQEAPGATKAAPLTLSQVQPMWLPPLHSMCLPQDTPPPLPGTQLPPSGHHLTSLSYSLTHSTPFLSRLSSMSGRSPLVCYFCHSLSVGG